MNLSGLEFIANSISPQKGLYIAPEKCFYFATTTLLEWQQEDGAVGADGNTTSNALSDFVVLLRPLTEHSDKIYCENLQTFPRSA